MELFRINSHQIYDHNMQGFKMTFANGYTVSVQFGSSNYCDKDQSTAEVGAWNEVTGEWVKLSEHDDVKGYCSPEEVLEIMNQIANK